MKSKTKFLPLLVLLLALAGIFLLPSYRLDMTADKRYTLAGVTKNILQSVREPVHVEVFLKGSFPSYFTKLAKETEQILEQFHRTNKKITYHFTDPLKNRVAEKLEKQGMKPAEVSVQKGGELQRMLVYPWAKIEYKGKEETVPLLVHAPGVPIEEQINRSIQNLEYALAYGISKLTNTKKPKIAVLKGNGELPDIQIADLLMSLRDFYRLAPFTLDSLETHPQKTIKELQKYDLLLLAKPMQKFTDAEKFALDQFLMSGGTMLMAIDPVKAHKDTLMYHGKTYALNAELNLTDWLFAYGVRLRPVLVKDLMAAPVTLKVGEVGGNPQLEQFPWFYSPLVRPNPQHPIGINVGEVKLDFASVVDTLKNGLRKTILLQSSPYTQIVGVPIQINFDEIARKPDEKKYRAGPQIFGVLVEGDIPSAYKDRIKPVDGVDFKSHARTKFILIADGDILKNDVNGSQPFPLGYDKWSRLQYDNKAFILNAIRYLTDKTGLQLLKNKKIKLVLADKNKIVAEITFWRWLNMLVPVALLLLFFGFFMQFRKKIYRKSL